MTEGTLQPIAHPGSEEQALELPRVAGGEFASVILHNDEVTPYDFVIDTLNSLFMLSEEIAEHIAYTAHSKGVAVVVVRPRGEAEKLVKVGLGRARMAGFPLTFTLEQS